MEDKLGEHQGGFRRRKADQILTLKQTLFDYYDHYYFLTHTIPVDFKKVYDTVNRSKLLNSLKELEILPKN